MNASGFSRNFKKRMAIFICLTQLVSLLTFATTVNAADSTTLPDLVVTKIVLSPTNPEPGDLVTLSVVVKNQGGPLAANSKFTVGCDFGDGIYYYSGPVSKALKKNETLIVPCTGGSGPDGAKWKATVGKHILNSMADNFANPDTGFRVVKESNENNNATQMTITVLASKKPSEAPKATPKPKPQAAGAYYISSDKNEKVDEGIGKLTEDINNVKNAMAKLSKVNKNKKANKVLLDKTTQGKVTDLIKYSIKKVVSGSASKANIGSSKFSAYWDKKNLYVLVNVIDAVKIKDSVNVWDDDAVEILLDMDHDKGNAYGPDDFQYFFNWNTDIPTETKQNALKGVTFTQADTEKGYVIFATIPWATVGKTPKENSFIGFDIAVDDDNNKATRESQTMWNAKDDQAYSHPDRFGDLQILKGNNTPGSAPVPTASTAPSLKPLTPEYKIPAGRGATIPWTEYEAENGRTSGKIIGPSLTFGEKAAEASGRKYVELKAKGQFIEFTTTNSANSIVVRHSIPDAPKGGGITTPISLYVNGVYKQDLMLSSKYNWSYGRFPWYNNPAYSSAHHFFDESRALIGDIPVGSKIKLQVDGKDIASYYDIDLVDLEQVDPAISKPTDFLSITDFGAIPNDRLDDTNAINGCISAAKSAGKGVFIPEGTFNRIQGPKIETSNSGFSGSGYITGYGVIGATARVDVSGLPATGNYDAVLRYSNGSGVAQTVSLYANGTKVSQVSLAPTVNWRTWASRTITIKLKAGSSGIEVVRDNGDSGNIALDYLKVNNIKYEMEKGYFTCPIYVDNVTIKGAGMWYSKLEGYFSQFVCTGNNCKFYDFSVLGESDSRNDLLGDNAFAGNAGTGSVLRNIWVEHTKCGFWVGNSNLGRTDGLLISGCRFRNTMADGVNLCDGTTNSIIENCTARNTGDDSFAIWSATYNTAKWSADNNIIRHCTTQLPWLAQGIALYGGKGNTAQDNLIIDTPTASGILVSTTFECTPFSGITSVQRNSIVRSGSLENGLGGLRIMCDTQFGISGLKVIDLDIYDSTDSGIRFMGSSALSNTTFDNININYCGFNGIYASIEVKGSAIFKNVTVKNSTAAGLRDNSSSKFKFIKAAGDSGW